MSQLGLFTLAVPGHLNPSITLASALRDRGHDVTFFTLMDGVEKIQRAGFQTHIFGEHEFSADRLDQYLVELSRLSGLKAVKFTIDLVRARDEVALSELPEQLGSSHWDGFVVDQVFPAAAALARAADIPYVALANALPLNLDPAVPPVISHDRPSNRIVSRLRRAMLNRIGNHLFQSVLKQLNDFQRQQGLPQLQSTEDLASNLAQINQIPRAFDFPRQNPTDKMHYVGPLHSLETRESTDFPWDRIDPNRPLIYASMGTLQNRIRHVFHLIAEACADLPVQLVMSFGGSADPDEFSGLAGDPIAVRFAPQLQLLKKASICITHAGLNTAMEALACGVPMLAIPVTNDQPGVAARIEHYDLGKRIMLRRLNSRQIKRALESLLSESTHRENARSMQSAIQGIDGPAEAARVIEQVFATGQPVKPAHYN